MTSDRPLLIRLIRHGESAANAGQPSSDPATIPLTGRGRQQAQAIADALTSPPAAIVCSPFLRARQTAMPSAARFGLEPEIWPIQEFTYLSPASCIGTTAAQRRARVEAYWHDADPDAIDGPGAESFAQFFSRIRTALEKLRTFEAQGEVLVFGHGQFMQAMRWLIEHGRQSSWEAAMAAFRNRGQLLPIGNCDGFILARSGGALQLD